MAKQVIKSVLSAKLQRGFHFCSHVIVVQWSAKRTRETPSVLISSIRLPPRYLRRSIPAAPSQIEYIRKREQTNPACSPPLDQLERLSAYSAKPPSSWRKLTLLSLQYPFRLFLKERRFRHSSEKRSRRPELFEAAGSQNANTKFDECDEKFYSNQQGDLFGRNAKWLGHNCTIAETD